jgi:multicomponent Na+:H+ antiporter subunit C
MEAIFAVVFGLLVTVATYLLLARNVLRVVVGLLVLSNGVNLAIFIGGRLSSAVVPIIPEGTQTVAESANPLPQALLLTAIVISFALAAFATVLFDAANHALGTLDTDAMREAEPETAPRAQEPGHA